MTLETVPGFAIWLTGLPASGKTSLATVLRPLLRARGAAVQILDSDDLREIFTPTPTYSAEERDWFYNVITYLAGLLTNNGVNVLIAATAPQRTYREAARARIARFAEVYVACTASVCRARDPKRLWQRADKGEITDLPGADLPYEVPPAAEIRVDTDRLAADDAARFILDKLDNLGFFHPDINRDQLQKY